MDQVVLVGPKDIASLRLHIIANYLHNQFVNRTFYILAESILATSLVRDLTNQLDPSILSDIIFINEIEVLNPDICTNSWIYQQLLKLNLDKLRESYELSETFFISDVDTICLRKTLLSDFQYEGQYIFFTKSDTKKSLLADNFYPAMGNKCNGPAEFDDWFFAMSWTTYALLGLSNPSRFCAIDACTIWSQKLLRQLKRRIEETREIINTLKTK